jgi:hypothetical protein
MIVSTKLSPSIEMSDNCLVTSEQFFSYTFSKSSETALGHSFSQQCKNKQLKRYKVIIDNCLKCSDKTSTFLTITFNFKKSFRTPGSSRKWTSSPSIHQQVICSHHDTHKKTYSLGTKQLSLINSLEEDSLVATIIVDLKSGLIRGMASDEVLVLSEHFKQLSIITLYLFNCLFLHCCEKI